ncbi:MAG: HAD family hydrolase [Chloroflexi bacterium]|nr:HAD family hydrolase [Chloroflexota bacterium]
MAIKLLVFDWDQTLLDSFAVHRDALRYAAHCLGLPVPTEEEIVRTFAGSLHEQLELLFGGVDGVLPHYGHYYRQHHLTGSRAFPGVAEMLRDLRRDGYGLALLSNKSRSVAVAELAHTGLDSAFDHAVFRDDLGILKPDPAGVHSILRALGIPPEETLLAGDGAVDVEVARRAEVPCAAALWGSLHPEKALDMAPDYVWHTVADATAFFAGLRR